MNADVTTRGAWNVEVKMANQVEKGRLLCGLWREIQSHLQKMYLGTPSANKPDSWVAQVKVTAGATQPTATCTRLKQGVPFVVQFFN
jgi:hypothetical protein